MTPSDILLKATRLLKTKGWCQGSMANEDGAYCAVGAMQQIAGYFGSGPISQQNSNSYHEARAKVDQLLAPGMTLTSWNDARGRKKADVIKLMEKARLSI